MITRPPAKAAAFSVILAMTGCASLFPANNDGAGMNTSSAEAALRGGSAETALQVSEVILRRHPDDVEAQVIKADALSQLGQYPEAAAIYQTLLARDPDFARAGLGLGRVKLASDPSAAVTQFQKVLAKDPNNLTALNNLGIAHDLLFRHAEAQAAYRRALAIEPGQTSTEVNLALSLAMSGQAKEGVTLLKPKATQAGATAQIRHDYAVVLTLAGQKQEASRILSETMSPLEVRQAMASITGQIQAAAADQTATTQARADTRDPWTSGEAVARQPVASTYLPSPMATAAAPWPGTMPTAAAAVAPAAMPASPPGEIPRVTRPGHYSDESAATAQMPVLGSVTVDSALTPAGDLTALPRDMNPNHVVVMPAQAAASLPPLPTAPPAPSALLGWPVSPTAAPPAPVASPMVSPAPVFAAPVQPAAERGGTNPLPRGTDASGAINPPSVASAQTPAAVRMADARAVPQAALQPAPAPAARDVPSGGMIQFTAAPSEAAAQAVWSNLAHRFPDVLGHRDPVVIRVERDGRVFWRLRADGFGSADEARTVCARVRGSGQDCFVPRS